jgi:hypothetical protein
VALWMKTMGPLTFAHPKTIWCSVIACRKDCVRVWASTAVDRQLNPEIRD